MERGKVLRLAGYFLALMLALTMLSRASASMTVARVTTASPGRMAIYHTVTAVGKVMENQEQAVSAEPGQRVARILVHEGDGVDPGEVLFEVDTGTLREQIGAVEGELAKLVLDAKDQRTKQKLASEKRDQAILRAQEDYQLAVSEGEQSVSWASWELQQAQAKYEQALGGGDVIVEIDASESSGEDPEVLADAVDAAQKAYEEAVNARDAAVREAARALEDARMPETADSTLEQNRMEQKQKESRLAKLRKLLEQKGQVTSPVKGVVTGENIRVGEMTAEGAAILLADLTSGCKFVTQVEKSQADYLGKSDTVTLVSAADNKTVEDLRVASVSVNEEDQNLLDVTVYLPADTLEIGSSAEMTAKQKSGTYETCIPIQALHESAGESFVYVVKEKDSVLGRQLAAQKISVQVQDRNESYAALSDGSLSSDEQVIVDASRSISGGSPVRLEAQ